MFCKGSGGDYGLQADPPSEMSWYQLSITARDVPSRALNVEYKERIQVLAMRESFFGEQVMTRHIHVSAVVKFHIVRSSTSFRNLPHRQPYCAKIDRTNEW